MKERMEAQLRLMELNQRFLKEIEAGKGWNEVRDLMDEMKLIAKQLDNFPATVITMDNFPKLNQQEQASN